MDYQMKTTFWRDFSIAERFSLSAIKDTYRRALHEWKDNAVYLTELVIVLNWKCWEWYDKAYEDRSMLYSDLYYSARDYALDHLKGDDLAYFLKTTD